MRGFIPDRCLLDLYPWIKSTCMVMISSYKVNIVAHDRREYLHVSIIISSNFVYNATVVITFSFNFS